MLRTSWGVPSRCPRGQVAPEKFALRNLCWRGRQRHRTTAVRRQLYFGAFRTPTQNVALPLCMSIAGEPLALILVAAGADIICRRIILVAVIQISRGSNAGCVGFANAFLRNSLENVC